MYHMVVDVIQGNSVALKAQQHLQKWISDMYKWFSSQYAFLTTLVLKTMTYLISKTWNLTGASCQHSCSWNVSYCYHFLYLCHIPCSRIWVRLWYYLLVNFVCYGSLEFLVDIYLCIFSCQFSSFSHWRHVTCVFLGFYLNAKDTVDRMTNSNGVGYAMLQLESVKLSTCLLGSELYCGWCARSFRCPNGLRNHCLTEHLQTCPCGRKFADDRSLLHHVQETGCHLPPTSKTNFFHAEGQTTVNANERTSADRDRSVESPPTKAPDFADGQKHTHVSQAPKPVIGSVIRKDAESPAELRFLRSCFASMFGGLMRCRLCSHVYAQWKTAYLHVRSAHEEELKKWQNQDCQQELLESGKMGVGKDRRKSQDAPVNSIKSKKRESVEGLVKSAKKLKSKQSNSLPKPIGTEESRKNIPISNHKVSSRSTDNSKHEALACNDKTLVASCNTKFVEKQRRQSSDSTSSKQGTVGRLVITKYCHVCRRTYDNLAAYMRHLSLPGRCADAFSYLTGQCQKLSDGRVECRICGEDFKSRSRVYVHIRLKHGIPDILPSDGRKAHESLGRAVADAGDGSVTSHDSHAAQSRRTGCPLMCLVCRRTFKWPSSLRRHKIICRYQLARKGKKCADSVPPGDHPSRKSSSSSSSSVGAGHVVAKQTAKPQSHASASKKSCKIRKDESSGTDLSAGLDKEKREVMNATGDIQRTKITNATKSKNVLYGRNQARCIQKDDMFYCSLCGYCGPTMKSVYFHITSTKKPPHNANTIQVLPDLFWTIDSKQCHFTCMVCNVVYKKRHHVKRHVQSAHPDLMENLRSEMRQFQQAELNAEAENATCTASVATVKTNGAKPRRFNSLRAMGVTCIKCGFTFKSRSVYLQHHAVCKGKKKNRYRGTAEELAYLASTCQRVSGDRTVCRLCTASVSRHSDIYRHIRDKHGIPNHVADGVNRSAKQRVESDASEISADTATWRELFLQCTRLNCPMCSGLRGRSAGVSRHLVDVNFVECIFVKIMIAVALNS